MDTEKSKSEEMPVVQSPYDEGTVESLEYKKGTLYFHLPDYSGHFKLNYLFTTLEWRTGDPWNLCSPGRYTERISCIQ